MKRDVDNPFFIVGCVRSGTTLLRNLLRMHDRLECPEETHFFRWSDPLGSERYEQYFKGKTLARHHEIDGISRAEFHYMLKWSNSKKELAERYARLYLKKKGKPGARWFDKTPQNVYGLLQVAAAYPDAKLIHIHRNPLNVVTSLLEGKVMPVHSLKGGINYWVESIQMIHVYKPLAGERLLEIAYEDLTQDPQSQLHRILTFLGEEPYLNINLYKYVHRERNKYLTALSSKQILRIQQRCEPFFSHYGYVT